MIKTKKLFEILGVAVVGQATFFSLIGGSSEPERAQLHSGFLQGDLVIPPPLTILNYCNNTTSKLFLAHAYLSEKQGWISHGWWAVLPQECTNVNIIPYNMSQVSKNSIGVITSYNSNVYIYAFNESNGEYRGSDASFCIDKLAKFEFANADTRNCSGKALKRVGMKIWRVSSGDNRYNFK